MSSWATETNAGQRHDREPSRQWFCADVAQASAALLALSCFQSSHAPLLEARSSLSLFLHPPAVQPPEPTNTNPESRLEQTHEDDMSSRFSTLHILVFTFSSPFLCLFLSTIDNPSLLSHPAPSSRSTSNARPSRDPCTRDTYSSLRGAEVDPLRSNSAAQLPRSVIALLYRHGPIIAATSSGAIPTPHGTIAATI